MAEAYEELDNMRIAAKGNYGDYASQTENSNLLEGRYLTRQSTGFYVFDTAPTGVVTRSFG